MRTILFALGILVSGAASAQTTSITLPNGAIATNDRTAGYGQFADTRSCTTAHGASYSNTRNNGPSGYFDTLNVTRANGATYTSQRSNSGGNWTHSWSGATAGAEASEVLVRASAATVSGRVNIPKDRSA